MLCYVTCFISYTSFFTLSALFPWHAEKVNSAVTEVSYTGIWLEKKMHLK